MYMRKKEVCEMLNISMSTLLRLMNSGKIPYHKNGLVKSSKVFFKREDVLNYLETTKRN